MVYYSLILLDLCKMCWIFHKNQVTFVKKYKNNKKIETKTNKLTTTEI